MRAGHDCEALGTDGCSAERRNDVKSPSSPALGFSKPKPQSGTAMESEIVLADIVLPCVCRCNKILVDIEALEAHFDAGHFERKECNAKA